MFNWPLPIDKVFETLTNPRNLSQDEFLCLSYYFSLNISWKTYFNNFLPRIVSEDGVIFETPIDFLTRIWGESRSEIRRLIKSRSLRINNIQITETTILSNDLFYNTGQIDRDGDEILWTPVKSGKKDCDIIFSFKFKNHGTQIS